MNTKTVGYFASYLTKSSKEDLRIWLNNFLSKDDLFFIEINGKLEGGEVIDKAHLTLFYGIDDSVISEEEIDSFLVNNIVPKDIKIDSVTLFATENPELKILVLLVNDVEGHFKKMHLKIRDGFSYFPEQYKYKNYTPHITLAYVKESFDISKFKIDTVPPIILDFLEYRKHIKLDN